MVPRSSKGGIMRKNRWWLTLLFWIAFLVSVFFEVVEIVLPIGLIVLLVVEYYDEQQEFLLDVYKKRGKSMRYRELRCCMCPNTSDPINGICSSGSNKPEVSDCDFVVVWTDYRGWKYKVMGDLAGTYKGRYQDNKHDGDTGWKGMRQLDRRVTFDEAQEDLNKEAKKKGWFPYTIKP